MIIDGRDIDLLVSGVNHRILTGIYNVYLPAVNRLLKGLSGVDESYLTFICVEVLGYGLVMHMLNKGMCCSCALHTRLYTCELLHSGLNLSEDSLSQTLGDRSCDSSALFY